jgi:hypothetical protein
MALHDPVPSAQADESPGTERKLGLALLVISSAQLMLVLDDTIVNVALPRMQRSLHIPASHLNWVASFYALTFGGLLLAGGRAGDLYGRLRLFRLGLVVFALASMAGGFAPNVTTLLIARLVQGCGAAIAAPGALSLLTTTFPAGPARTKAIGIYGAMARSRTWFARSGWRSHGHVGHWVHRVRPDQRQHERVGCPGHACLFRCWCGPAWRLWSSKAPSAHPSCRSGSCVTAAGRVLTR